MHSNGNSKEALATLVAVTAKLPEKQDAAFKSAIATYEEHIKLVQELADCYDRAVQKVLYYDPVPKTRFQFADAAKFCADNVSRLKYDANRKDLLEMAELFKSADKIVAALRKQLGTKPIELASLAGYNNVNVTVWDDKGLTFVPPQFSQPQPFTWESAIAPDIILQVAKELRKPDLDKSTGQWDIGVLAFAMGNQTIAAKYIRDAVAKDDSPFKSQAAVALKLLKPAEVAAVKPPRKN